MKSWTVPEAEDNDVARSDAEHAARVVAAAAPRSRGRRGDRKGGGEGKRGDFGGRRVT